MVQPAAAPDALPHVTVSGVGVVSLAPLEAVRAARAAAQESADALWRQTAECEARAEDRLADAGALLVPRHAWWQPPPELQPMLLEADRLAADIARLDRGRPTGLSRWRRARAASRLRQILLTVARVGAEAGIDVPGVEPVLEEAADLTAQARALRSALDATRARLGQMDHEIRQREDACRRLGFDALHFAAHFQAVGVPVVESPVELARGETAHLVVEAALGRPVAMAAPAAAPRPGASLAYTGIHHWVGERRSGPAPVTGPPLDSGVLVATNERLLFAGAAGSVEVPLAAVLAIDVYDDGLTVLQLGRGWGDLFLVREPAVIAFYVNWVSEKLSPRRGRR